MRAMLLLLTAGCASTSPTAALRTLVAHPVNLAALPGPGPHPGLMLVGSADAAEVGGLPVELLGAGGSADVLPGRSRAKVVDGLLHFAAAVRESDFRRCVGDDPRLSLRFAGGAVAAGRVILAHPLSGTLGDTYPVWRER